MIADRKLGLAEGVGTTVGVNAPGRDGSPDDGAFVGDRLLCEELDSDNVLCESWDFFLALAGLSFRPSESVGKFGSFFGFCASQKGAMARSVNRSSNNNFILLY